MYKRIKSEIDKTVGKSQKEVFDHIERSLRMGIPYAMRDYDRGAKMVKYIYNQFSRVGSHAILFLIDYALEWIRKKADNVDLRPSQMDNYVDFARDGKDRERAKMLLESAMRKIPKVYFFGEPLTGIANDLDEYERKILAIYCKDMISYMANKTNWDKNSSRLALSLLSIEYAICKHDEVMDLFFSSVMNVTIRLNSSMYKQQANDLANTIVLIGYREHLEEYSYVVSSFSYIDASDPLQALLCLVMAFAYLDKKYEAIPKRFIFFLIWILLKILREINRVKEEEMNILLKISDSVSRNGIERLSVHITALSAKVFIGDESVINETISYLKENETTVKSNMKSVSLPLFTLFKSMHEFLENQDLSGLAPYEKMIERDLKIDGNEFYVDFYENKGLAGHLLKMITKLKNCRSSINYGHYSKTAQKIARKVVESSVNDDDPEAFLLAMMVRADFSFVIQDFHVAPFVIMEFEDGEIGKNTRPFISLKDLRSLLNTDHEDILMWIGLGIEHICRLSLLNDMFRMDFVGGLGIVNYQKNQLGIITNLQFRCDYVTAKGDRFDKSVTELEEEGARLYDSLKFCRMSVPNVVSRVLIVKDMEMESYPHHLLVDERTNKFIGQCIPMANVISTELLIKTNGSMLCLPLYFSRSFWTPIQSGELTFSGIKSHLENTLIRYQFDICEKIVPSKPLSSDLNIVCAHGGKNISEDEWFYANSQPIVDTNKIVGQGELLVLFVCHSGSAVYEEYDGAVHSMVKKYIRMGYKSVIAPMWSLSTDILSLWLTTFMDCFMSGEYIIDAVFHANMSLKEKYTAPSAWACLHLFGNPYLKVVDKDFVMQHSC